MQIEQRLKEMRQRHLNQGFVDYENSYCDYINELQTHFYKTQIMQGIIKYPAVIQQQNWHRDIQWERIWTNKFVYCSQYEAGAFKWNDSWIKDQYYDISKEFMPLVDISPSNNEMDLYEECRRIVLENHDLSFFYKAKPPVLVYLVGAIENKDNYNFVPWYNLLLKNIEKINKL